MPAIRNTSDMRAMKRSAPRLPTITSASEPITLRVIDLSGRLVQVKTGITTNNTLQIGQDLMPGSYILQLIQGNKKAEQKLIKLSK